MRVMQPWKHPKSGLWFARQAVPEKLRPALGGRWELKRSLGTKDAAEARRRHPKVAAEFAALLARAALSIQTPHTLTHDDCGRIAAAYLRAEIDATPVVPDEVAADAYGDLLDDVKDYQGPEDFRDAARSLLARHGLLADRTTLDRLSSALHTAQLEALFALRRRAEGALEPTEAERWAATAPAFEPPRPTLTPEKLIEAWKRERSPDEKVAYETERHVRALIAHAGTQDPAAITTDHAKAWRASLLAAGDAPATLGRKVGAARAVFGVAVDHGLLKANPFDGVKTTAGSRKARSVTAARLPYSDADAKLIWEGARALKGGRRWLGPLLLATGCRINEVTQSRKEDVRQVAGHWVLDVHANGEGRSIKTASSARLVPLHPLLIAEGFVDYVQALPKGAEVFGDFGRGAFGRRASKASEWFSKWARTKLGIVDPRKVAHSARHRFKDLCRAAGVSLEIHDKLTGHQTPGVGARYGQGHGVEALAKAVASLKLLDGLGE
jgi:integrase